MGSLPQDELFRLGRVLNLPENSGEWGYGSRETDDGLFVAKEPALHVAGDYRDLFVLSGLIGKDLVNRSNTLRRSAEALRRPGLDTMVVMGGLAVAVLHSRNRYVDKGSSAFTSGQLNGIQSVTRVGATLHGDFLASRGYRFVDSVVDPVGGRQMFAPSIPEIRVGAYHSTEPEVLSSLLLHKATRSSDAEMQAFHDSLLSQINRTDIGPAGPFADYGESDGDLGARIFRYEMLRRKTNEAPSIVGSMIVSSDSVHTIRMVMESTQEGVAFRYDDTDDQLGEDYDGGFVLLDEEIEPFIVALFESNSGRTSPRALLRILSEIDSRKATS